MWSVLLASNAIVFLAVQLAAVPAEAAALAPPPRVAHEVAEPGGEAIQ